MANNDNILDLACDCDYMSKVKTRWYGEDTERRFWKCGDEECGFHKWVNLLLGARAVSVIEELH